MSFFEKQPTLQNPHRWTSEHGGSLVGTLVAVAILGVVIAISASAFKQGADMHAQIVREGEHEDLRRYVRLLLSCDKTLSGAGCPHSLVLKRKNGAKLANVKNGSYVIGDYKLNASCSSQPNGERIINVQAEYKGTSINLFKAVPLVCPAPK